MVYVDFEGRVWVLDIGSDSHLLYVPSPILRLLHLYGAPHVAVVSGWLVKNYFMLNESTEKGQGQGYIAWVMGL